LEDCDSSEASLGKKFRILQCNIKSWAWWYVYHSSYGRRLVVQVGLDKKKRPYFKNNQSKKD
jgi:hypothetical protein